MTLYRPSLYHCECGLGAISIAHAAIKLEFYLALHENKYAFTAFSWRWVHVCDCWNISWFRLRDVSLGLINWSKRALKWRRTWLFTGQCDYCLPMSWSPSIRANVKQHYFYTGETLVVRSQLRLIPHRNKMSFGASIKVSEIAIWKFIRFYQTVVSDRESLHFNRKWRHLSLPSRRQKSHSRAQIRSPSNR